MLCRAAQNTLEPPSYALVMAQISTDSHARTAIVAHNSDWDTAISQFNAEGAERVRDNLCFRVRRDSYVNTPKSEQSKSYKTGEHQYDSF
jgi:hypothetical protein